jgi:hypothetical protein
MKHGRNRLIGRRKRMWPEKINRLEVRGFRAAIYNYGGVSSGDHTRRPLALLFSRLRPFLSPPLDRARRERGGRRRRHTHNERGSAEGTGRAAEEPEQAAGSSGGGAAQRDARLEGSARLIGRVLHGAHWGCRANPTDHANYVLTEGREGARTTWGRREQRAANTATEKRKAPAMGKMISVLAQIPGNDTTGQTTYLHSSKQNNHNTKCGPCLLCRFP